MLSLLRAHSNPASLNVAQLPFFFFFFGFSQSFLGLFLICCPMQGNCGALHVKNEIDGIKIEKTVK